MTRYIASYDTERGAGLHGPAPSCVEACKAIVAMHKQHNMPATFFIVGATLEESPDAFRRLLDDPLFEIASHTWSHRMLKDNPFCGKAVPPDAIREEIFRGRESVLKHFPEQACIGLRPGCSFEDGLAGAPQVIEWVIEAGYEYVSSLAWGPDYTLPAPLNQASTYAADGFADLWEYPCHGWHENVLKTMSKPGYWETPHRLVAFPAPYPEAIPPGPIATAEDEFRYNNKVFIERAVRDRLDYVSLIWHPWSLGLFDPGMDMLDMTFRYVQEAGLRLTTFAAMHQEQKSTKQAGSVKGRGV